MTATLIDGAAIAEKINAGTRARIARLKKQGVTPRLEVVLVGDDKPSATYVRKKGEAAEKLGIDFKLHALPSKAKQADLIKTIKTIQKNPSVSGLIVQLPLPDHLRAPSILNAINSNADVDCLTDKNLGRLMLKTNWLEPPAPGAVMSILDELTADVAGKNVTIIGLGALVGRPLAVMLMNKGASLTTVNSRTKNTKDKCLSADIIVTAVGKKNLLRGEMVKRGAIVIDTGVAFEKGKMYGDVAMNEVAKKASFVTPTPGGVGPITVARLLLNTVICAERKYDLGFLAKT